MSLFAPSVRHATLLRQSIVGADEAYYAICAGIECEKQVARMGDDGKWTKLEPFDFDHMHERAAKGDNSAANCQALCAVCHREKTNEFLALNAKADAQAGRTGQYARRRARKARGEGPLIKQSKNAWGHRNG